MTGEPSPASSAALATVFMGTPEIAVPALRLLAARTRVRAVITQPDRAAGRGHQVRPSAVKLAALDLALPVWQPETLKGQASAPHLDGIDLAVVMAYGELLRQDVLDRPAHGCINLHASILPRWRGASPLQAAIRAGDRRSGVTVMGMVRTLDAGPIHLVEDLDLGERPTLPAVHDAMALTAARALGRLLDDWPDVPAEAQDDTQATFCRKLTADDGRLDFTATALELDRWVRAYTPAPGCWAMGRFADGSAVRLRIHGLEPRSMGPAPTPGAVTVADGDLLVGCADGALAITRLQAPDRRAMTAREFLHGHPPPLSLG